MNNITTSVLDEDEFYIVQMMSKEGIWIAIYDDVGYLKKGKAFEEKRKVEKLNPLGNYRIVKCKIERTVVEE
jgi:hypothetical protein